MHDPRLGRFFAVDPLTKKYPHYSPYSFSGNKVIAFRELEGLEEEAVAATCGPPGWVYIAGKWIIIGAAAYLTAATADKVINEFKEAPEFTFEPVSTLPKVDVDIKPSNNKKPETKPDPKPVFPDVNPDNKPDDDDDNYYFYRVMAVDKLTNHPEVPTTNDPDKIYSRQLGARANDVAPLLNDDKKTVSPKLKRGMSLMLTNNISTLPSNMQKKINEGKLKVFRIPAKYLLMNKLISVPDGVNHASLKPAGTQTVEEYQKNIKNTAPLWEQVPANTNN